MQPLLACETTITMLYFFSSLFGLCFRRIEKKKNVRVQTYHNYAHTERTLKWRFTFHKIPAGSAHIVNLYNVNFERREQEWERERERVTVRQKEHTNPFLVLTLHFWVLFKSRTLSATWNLGGVAATLTTKEQVCRSRNLFTSPLAQPNEEKNPPVWKDYYQPEIFSSTTLRKTDFPLHLPLFFAVLTTLKGWQVTTCTVDITAPSFSLMIRGFVTWKKPSSQMARFWPADTSDRQVVSGLHSPGVYCCSPQSFSVCFLWKTTEEKSQQKMTGLLINYHCQHQQQKRNSIFIFFKSEKKHKP